MERQLNISSNFPLVYVQGTGTGCYNFGLENNQLKVSVSDFYISACPVTQQLWQQVMGNNPSTVKSELHPVGGVSFDDAGAFFERLNGPDFKQEGRGKYRLPTETEWEYAARGGIYWGDYFVYAGSDNIDEVGWYKHNSGNKIHPVGQKQPNQLGIYDMSGNIWEWGQDYFQRDAGKIPPTAVHAPKKAVTG